MASDKVTKCVLAFNRAKSDAERCGLLRVMAEALRDSDSNAVDRRLVFESIGLDFITRLLFVEDGIEDCPPPLHIYQGLALNLLATFCSIPDYFKLQPMDDQIPQFLHVLKNYGFNKEERAMKHDALTCLITLTANRRSCYSIVECDGMKILCEIYAQDDARHNFKAMVFSVLSSLINQLGSECWHRCPKDYHILMNVLTKRLLAEEKSQKKFVMCDVLLNVLESFPSELRDACSDTQWYRDLNTELLGILRFKLGDAQREPLMKLCATLVNKLGVTWALGDGGDKSIRLFLLFVQLCCVEVRMITEVRNFEEVMLKCDMAVVIFSVLESSIQFLVDDSGQIITEQAKLHMCNALTGAFGGIMNFLRLADKKFTHFYDDSTELERNFVITGVRVIGAWLAEETAALRDEVYELLPFLLKVATEERKNENSANCLRFLLPALCHLSVENPARTILLEWKIPSLLTSYMMDIWDTFLLDLSLECGDSDQGCEHYESEAENSLVTVCGILMNVIVLEAPSLNDEDGLSKYEGFVNLMQFTFMALPHVDMKVRHLILRGNLAVLGILLLRSCHQKSKCSEGTICRYLSAFIRFLWDAFSVEESSSGFTVVVAFAYRSIWNQVRELWYLGMQALSGLLTTVPWIADFIIESGWAKEIVVMLRKATKSGLQDSIRTAYENFLCSLVNCCNGAVDHLKECDAVKVCEIHKMKSLGKLLRSHVSSIS